MDKTELLSYLEAIDALLGSPASLCVYGSAAFILLDEPARTSLDIDVAGPYSRADMAELRRVAASVGLPINPDESYSKNHIEWVSAVRHALRAPDPGSEVLLWRGRLPPPFSTDKLVLDNLLALKEDMALWMETS